MRLRHFPKLIGHTVSNWNEHKVPQLAAALSYYAVFSMAPLLIILITVIGLVYGRQAAQNEIVTQFQHMVGDDGAKWMQTVIENSSQARPNLAATILGIIAVLLGATNGFRGLKDALNQIWSVPPRPSSGPIRDILKLIQQHFVAFVIVLGIGLFVIFSIILSTFFSSISNLLGTGIAPLAAFGEALNVVVSFAVISFLFAAVYKLLPDVKIKWSDVWSGAVLTAILFTFGKFLIGLYLGRTGVASSYGAAGSLVAILIWVNFSVQILLMGAEFTQVYTNAYGSRSGRKRRFSVRRDNDALPPIAERPGSAPIG